MSYTPSITVGSNDYRLTGVFNHDISTVTSGNTTQTTGGTARTVFTANSARLAVFIGNPHASESLWFSITGTAAANAAGSIEIPPGASVLLDGAEAKLAVSIIGAITGQPITAYTKA